MKLTKLQNKILLAIAEGLDPVPSSVGIDETNHVEKEGFYASRKSLVKKGVLDKKHRLTPLGYECYLTRSSNPKKKHRTEPDWSSICEICGASPVVPNTDLCGPCTFGEADTANGDW